MMRQPKLTRRTFTAGTLAGLAITGTRSTAAEGASLPEVLIDTHLHCFAGPTPQFPYHKRAPYRPADAATPEHLLKCMDGAGVDYAIVVHPEPYQDDHRYLTHCLEVGGGRLKGTALFFADRPGSLEKLPTLARNNHIVAARLHAYAPDRLPPFGKPELRRIWEMAAKLGIAVQLHFEPKYAKHFTPLIREFKTVTHIIDHLGRPFQGTPDEYATVLSWADDPNVVIKLAAIPDQGSYPHRDIRPVIRKLTAEFGADRMICGGGFGSSATPQSYRAAFERTRAFVEHLSADEQAKILGLNAKTLFGFGA